jgi:acetyl esterase/lipase
VRPLNSPHCLRRAARPPTILIAIVLVALLAACSPLKTLRAFTSGSGTRAIADVAYGALPRHRLDIHLPTPLSTPAPVVVFFYGGSWNSGEKDDYAFVGRMLARRGIITVIADYRLYPEVRYPSFLHDGALALAWTARNIARHGGDPARLFVMGHSAGAYNAAMLALDPRWLAAQDFTPAIVRGWIGLAGPYDFLPVENPDVRPVFFHPNTPPDSQPLVHAARGAPPALLIAARRDNVVNPVRNTGGLAARLRGLDVPVQEIYFDNVDHVTLMATLSGPLQWLAPTLDTVEEFIHKPQPQRALSPP